MALPLGLGLVGGAVGAGLVALLLALAGPNADTPDRLTALEASVGDKATRRTAEALEKRAQTAEQALQALRGDLAALQSRPQLAPGDLTPLTQRIDRLDRAVAQLAARPAGGGEAAAAAPVPLPPVVVAGKESAALAVAMLIRDAVGRGTPYARELAALEASGADAAQVARLKPLAASGAPQAPALAAAFAPLAATLARGPEPAPNAGVVDRMTALIGGAVRIRPVGEAAGETPAAVGARAEAALRGATSPPLYAISTPCRPTRRRRCSLSSTVCAPASSRGRRPTPSSQPRSSRSSPPPPRPECPRDDPHPRLHRPSGGAGLRRGLARRAAGEVVMTVEGYRVETSVLAAVGLVAALAVGLMLAIWLLRALLRLPSSIGFAARARRRSRGYAAISRGMVAVGAGDPKSARRNADDAGKLIGDEPLVLLLKAQAAQMAGDRPAAEGAFRRMLDDPDTRVLGLRGLFVEARRKGDAAAARAYAAEASRLAPTVAWSGEALLEYQCADADWQAALATLERGAKAIDKATYRRQRAVLLTADALGRVEREPDLALQRAQEAVKLAPTLVPAVALLARLLSRRGELRKASRAIETAWTRRRIPISRTPTWPCASATARATGWPAPRSSCR